MSLAFTGHVSVLKLVDGVWYLGYVKTEKTIITSEDKERKDASNTYTYFSSKIEKVIFSDLQDIVEIFKEVRPDLLEAEFKPLSDILGRSWLLEGEVLSIELVTNHLSGNSQVGLGSGLVTEFIKTEGVYFQPELSANRKNVNHRLAHVPQVKRFS